MTAANLAVIFGPNLLQRERGSDSSPHIYAMGIEDSTAIINVTLVLIQNYKRLFTVRSHDQTSISVQIKNEKDLSSYNSSLMSLQVSAELQQEVLMSLIQTDPDIIDYLLRRKLR